MSTARHTLGAEHQPTSRSRRSICRTVCDRSVVWILKYRLTRCTFHRQPPRWMQAAGWDREDLPCAHSYRRSISFLPHLPHLLLTMHFLCLLFRCLTFLSTLDGNLENRSPCASNLSAHHRTLRDCPRYIYFTAMRLPSARNLRSFYGTLKVDRELPLFQDHTSINCLKKEKKKAKQI